MEYRDKRMANSFSNAIEYDNQNIYLASIYGLIN